ncbi:TPA: type A chloramphenicol O-acetyltransferase [Enterococcus faecium]|nr:type A chloramphenicol O-acetyltransferase [Enterococcus faecium]HAQ6521944.1 type A chloramphenicol O-acetyltransferase [Enterococcus faecium]
MTFNIINLETWDRKEYFNHYFNQQTTYSVTKELDITLLKSMIKDKYELYPALIHAIVSVINRNKVFRTGINSEGNLGYWDKLEPLYTVFNKETEKFSNIWTESNASFNSFYNSYKNDLFKYKDKNEMFPKKPIPENTVPISMIPWIDFSSFNLNIGNNSRFLLPIITIGKFYSKDDKIYLPFSLQVHHAVCDGYHVSLFMNEFQNIIDNVNEWI